MVPRRHRAYMVPSPSAIHGHAGNAERGGEVCQAGVVSDECSGTGNQTTQVAEGLSIADKYPRREVRFFAFKRKQFERFSFAFIPDQHSVFVRSAWLVPSRVIARTLRDIVRHRLLRLVSGTVPKTQYLRSQRRALRIRDLIVKCARCSWKGRSTRDSAARAASAKGPSHFRGPHRPAS